LEMPQDLELDAGAAVYLAQELSDDLIAIQVAGVGLLDAQRLGTRQDRWWTPCLEARRRDSDKGAVTPLQPLSLDGDLEERFGDAFVLAAVYQVAFRILSL